MQKQKIYEEVTYRIKLLTQDETDLIAILSTISCELFHAFDTFHWVGFYRNVGNNLLKVGPYLGGHGCLSIPYGKGVCGKCASEKKTQIVTDVNAIKNHIACSSSTQSEIVLPVFNQQNDLIAVLDIDSDDLNNFDHTDAHYLEKLLLSINTI
jgi:GAF domain-containing protein